MNADEMFAEQLIDIFAEEIEEVVQQIAGQLPLWKDDLHNLQPLTEIRRGFHTIKGSGRMVQAQQMAELAWAIENMLNHVLDKTIQPNASMVVLLDKVVDALPVLLTAFKNKQAAALAGVNVGMLIQHADSLRQEQAVAEIEQAASPKQSSSLLATSSDDPVLVAEVRILQENLDELSDRFDAIQTDYRSLQTELDKLSSKQEQNSKEYLQQFIEQRLEIYSREVKELRYFVKMNGERLSTNVEENQRRLTDKLAMELSQARSQRQGEQQHQQLAYEQLRRSMTKKVMAWSLSSAIICSIITFAAANYLL